ncbi:MULTISPECIES: hypothetical protein [unclassified Halorhabdus]|uniref:hypothetical protein n=1 Tax=unclassified Halorhabdus TaxID=2621901 RepID=UPI0023DB034C|nr:MULTISPECIES: hypothetical protein [unclassified Halorhabdus]WEL18567.1 hypothetical protein SVXHr_2417 [Halorhabdus sp. SVX81]WEL22455.1 hypothetical protein HBNXHr_2412 [Halorhabdus sp. BNX81]
MVDALIVEDDETTRSVLAERLASDGFKAVARPFASECRQFIANNGPPEVFVIDAVLPRADGVAFGRELADGYSGTVGVFLFNYRSRVDLSLSGQDATLLAVSERPGLEVFPSVDPERIAQRMWRYV